MKKRLLGAALVALPFVSFFAIVVDRDRWLVASLLYGGVSAVVAVFLIGIRLLMD